MKFNPSGLRSGPAAAIDLIGKAACLRRRGGSKRLVAASVIETAAAPLIDLFVEEHLQVVVKHSSTSELPRFSTGARERDSAAHLTEAAAVEHNCRR